MNKDLHNILASLPADKIRWLAKKMETKSQSKNHDNKPTPGHEFMLSASQQSMWLAMQMYPYPAAFNNPWAAIIHLPQPLNQSKFNKSISLLIENHEALRTGFEMRTETPVQVVKESKIAPVVFEDLRGLTEEEKTKICMEMARAEGLKSFDLASPPLFRVKVLRLQDSTYLFLITCHHLISDGWSNLIITKEIHDNDEGSISDNRFHYSDHVNWENDWIKTEGFQHKLAFWKNELKDLPAPLELPLTKARPPGNNYLGNMVEIDLPKDLSNNVRALCRQDNNTIFHFFLAVYKLLFFYYTGERDLVIGVPFANRSRKEVQQTVGLFMNALPVRTGIEVNASFRNLMNAIKKKVHKIMGHQEVSFERILKEINRLPFSETLPIFQVMFAYQNIPQVPGLDIKRFKTDYGFSKYDLNLWLEESAADLSLTLTYNSDIFTPATAKKLLDQFIRLSYAVLESPDTPVQSLGFLKEADLSCSIGKAIDFGTPQCFHRIFETQAIKTPDLTALDDSFHCISYKELNRRANQVAAILSANGLKTGDVAILQGSRSIHFVTALLGAMKCGVTFLPVDDTYPPERLQVICAQSGAAVMLQEKAFAYLAQSIHIPKITLDSLPLPGEKYDVNPGCPVNVKDIAYLIYTSGSTGVPKGVCIGHIQLFNYFNAISESMQIIPQERFGWISSHAFDLGFTMLFPCLAAGGRLVLIQPAMALHPNTLAEYLKNNPVDYLKIVPSHLEAILHCDTPKQIMPEKLLILGGEASNIEFIRHLQKLNPDCRIMNHYGPTETTVGVCTYEVPPTLSDDISILPIGNALPNNTLHIIKNGMLVPKGAIGEIYIGGAQLSPGYLKEPISTCKSFVPDPFIPNALLYKTGDLAKMQDDGTVVFLGRNDKQIKVRGYRVDLNEIELAIKQYPHISKAIVLYKNARLVAYFIADKDLSEIIIEEISLFLKKCLPVYMLPDLLIPIDSVPLNSNGKIDYHKLPAYDTKLSITITGSSLTEKIVCKIWQEVLPMADHGMQQDFFDAGGNSLSGMQFVHKVNKALQANIDISHLFQHSTIQKLSLFIETNRLADSHFNITMAKQGNDDTVLVLIHPAGGTVWCYNELVKRLKGNYTIYLIGMSPGQNSSIRALAKKYLTKILAISKGRQFIFAGWSMGSYIAFEMGCICKRPGVTSGVIIIDQPAPDYHSAQTNLAMDDAAQLNIFLRKVEQFTSSKINISADDLRNMLPDKSNDLMLEIFKSLSLVPQNVSTEDFRSFLDLLIAHNHAAINYEASKYNEDVLVISGLDSSYNSGPDLQWQPHCEKKIEIAEAPGNHASIMSDRNVNSVALIIEKWLQTHIIK